MSLELSVVKEEETADDCVYAFGPPADPVGRVRLHKASGDIELLDVPERSDGLNEHFYLTHLVPRLQAYHDRGTYPDRDRWTA